MIAEELNLHLNIIISVGKVEIEKLIREEFSDVPAWITLLEARNDIATYLNKTHIFLSTSREEGLCYALVEAGYCCCRLISSKIPGAPYYIPNCKVFESENADNLIQVIKETVTILAETQFDESKKYIEEYYPIAQWSEKIYEKLKEV